jgi:hypothetical protein
MKIHLGAEFLVFDCVSVDLASRRQLNQFSLPIAALNFLV